MLCLIAGSGGFVHTSREVLLDSIAMIEADYWSHLEYRVSREFAGVADPVLRHYWCDGFEPLHADLVAARPYVSGYAWIGTDSRGTEQARWDFELLLPCRYESRELIPWADLLPADHLTHWILIDRPGKRLVLDPSGAIPLNDG